MNRFISITLTALLSTPIATTLTPNEAIGYSQDPRSCGDPRGQFPSNPPCAKTPNETNKN